jgi:putative ABC transport system substrate-binding protein
MRRRVLLTTLGGAALAPASVTSARAQSVPVVAVLTPQTNDQAPVFAAFRTRLKELGRAEGRGLRLEFHVARGQPEQVRALAAAIVTTRPAVILADGALMVRTLKPLTTTIPIVGILGPDPVATGLVVSLGRPGANITGVTTLGSDLQPKRIELLKDAVPRLTRLAVLWDPGNDPGGLMRDAMSAHARQLQLDVDIIEGGRAELVAAALTPERLKSVDAVLVAQGPAHYNSREDIVGRVAASGKPAIYPERDYVVAGGLMSYGPNVGDVFRRMAEQVDRILKGAKPGDIAVEQVVRIEYVVNLKTAKALNLPISPIMINRADEVIE